MPERMSDDRLRKVADEGYALYQDRVSEMARELLALRARLAAGPVMSVRPGSEWREDMGPVLWLQFFDGETPLVYAGTPTDRRYPFHCSIVVFAKLPSDDEVRAADARERAICNALPE